MASCVRLLLVWAVFLAGGARAFVDEAVDVIRLSKEIGEEVLNSWDVLGRPFNSSSGVELPFIRRHERRVLARLGQVARAIERLEEKVEQNGAVARLLAGTGRRETRLELRLHELGDLLSRVAAAERQMRDYVRLQRELERSTLQDFAAWCVSHEPRALSGLLERVHALVRPPHQYLLGRGILQLMLEDLECYCERDAMRSSGNAMIVAGTLVVVLMVLAGTLAEEVTATDAARMRLYALEQQLWRNVEDAEWRQSGLGGDVELTKAFVAFDKQLESVPRSPRPPLDSWLWIKAVERLQVVDGFYKSFVEFARRQAVPGAVPAPVREWLDLAEGVLMDPSASVAQAVRKLHTLLEHGDLFRSPLQERHPDVCELQLSPHQLIYDMYNTISLAEIKGYAMMQFSWMLLKIYGKGNYTQEASLTRERYVERTARAAAAARRETYAQVTRLLQGYIENEVDMNTEQTCKENCGYYTLAQNHGCFKDMYCARQPTCKGRIINCQYIDSDMTVCPAKKGSTRRYEWIEYENGNRFGQMTSECHRGKNKVDSWWRLPYHCSYCFCLCEDDAYIAERSFSLREVLAAHEQNKVVTGIRLVKYGRVFHLQISEGTLGERGAVTPGGWVPVQKFDVNDAGVREGQDYHTLSYERRALDLDELDSPRGQILTGVRFSVIGAHLHFEIRSTPFNYTTGRLAPERNQWISNDNTDGSDAPRSRLELYKPDVPTRGPQPLQVDSKHDQYVEFTNSDFEKDAAQSTVPFVDIQPVEPMQGAALISGAGMIHRGARGSGGFVSPKLFTYDHSRHVHADPPPASLQTAEPDSMPMSNF
ncbi:unnamed protein product [Leptidea sinapis]|uniref:Peptidase M23 domain-containing protein n=1 Tax=Leptidea sinapis TaxID=189913 RepID=A0A5E4Q8A6_9NEOP|nr:unnamed protein product [Leptidea sinapis]